ncbi:MAG TPA: methyl-accepting chemotaxis protein [Chloroflexota bacterium]
MNLLAKLVLGFLGALLPLGVLSVVGILTLRYSSDNASSLYRQDLAPAATLGQLSANLDQMRLLMTQYVLTNKKDPVETKILRFGVAAQVKTISQSIKQVIDQYGARTTDADQQALLRQWPASWSAFQAELTRVEQLSAGSAADQSRASALLTTTFNDRLNSLLDIANGLVGLQQRQGYTLYTDSSNRSSLVMAFLLIGFVVITVLSIWVSILLTRSIARPVRRLTDAARKVASGDFSPRVTLRRSDELGILATSFNTMVNDLQAQTATLVTTEKRTRESADSLARGVTLLIEELAPVAEGDLTAHPSISGEGGDIAVIADFTGVLINTFAEVIRSVRGAAGSVQLTSDQLSTRVQQLALEVRQRTIQVNETASIAEQIADSATEVLDTVIQVNRSAQAASDSVDQGNSAVAQTLERMDAMRATMIQATRQIKKLSDSSLAMNSTVGLVLQFAGDLELLADNAQIEAARHREAGGVFTAVAEQTGRLAEDAQKALTDIQSAVLTNRQETAEVGRQMEQVATEVIASTRAVEEARGAFNDITRTVAELRGFVDRVSSVATAQVDVANAVNTAMQQIIAFFGQTAHGVQLSEADADELRRTIGALRTSIAYLKIEGDETSAALAAA